MKKYFPLLVLLAGIICGIVFSSCGSSWEISANNMTIIKVENDTIAPAGSLIILPDSSLPQLK